MSRIQQVLEKAQREGTARRTRGVADVSASEATPSSVLIGPDPPSPRFETDGEASARLRPPLPRLRADRAAQVDVVDTPLLPRSRPVATRRENASRPHPLLVAATAPHSPAAERYRALRTRIAQVENGTMRRVLMMTSPGRGEGKSMTSLNLAITMAQEFHRRVLVVDADLRQPSVHALLGLPLGPGLSDVLLGGASLEEALVTVPDYRLTVLPAGMPPEQPTELLGSTAMRRLLEQLRAQFDRILIDTPPVAPLADASVLVRLVDAAIVVVRAGVTPRPAIERALVDIEASRVLGLVLNDADGPEAAAYSYDREGGPKVAVPRRRTTAAASPRRP